MKNKIKIEAESTSKLYKILPNCETRKTEIEKYALL